MNCAQWFGCWCGRAAAVVALLIVPGLAALAGEPVKGINVSLEQIPGGIWIDFGNEDILTIPADFFGPGSLPFEGVVGLNLVEPMLTDRGDFLSLDGLPPGEPVIGAIPIEIVPLNLVSVEPITVQTPTGPAQYQLELSVTDALGATNPPSQLLIDLSEPDGGVVFAQDSFTTVFLGGRFVLAGGGSLSTPVEVLWDLQEDLLLSLQADTPWRHSEPGGTSTDGFFLGTDGTNVLPYTLASPDGGMVMNLHSVPVPEPASLMLAVLALLGTVGYGWSRRQGKQ